MHLAEGESQSRRLEHAAVLAALLMPLFKFFDCPVNAQESLTEYRFTSLAGAVKWHCVGSHP
ncbi:MAG: hypothetical protein JWM21_3849 [Acidobacteria bacterium]|nr:hypothetical protein [Acidobacteriota bacterium]